MRKLIRKPIRHVERWLQKFESPQRRQERVTKTLTGLAGHRMLPQRHIDYLKQLKARYAFEPEVIFDVGGCVLHWTNEASRIWPRAKFVVFDAVEAVEFIYRQSGHDYSIGVLSDVDRKPVSFFQNDLFPGGSSYYPENVMLSPQAKRLFSAANRQEKLARTLDAVVSERGFPLPQLVKLDVQGAELDVLKGAGTVLAHCRHLILELQHVEYNKGAPLKDEVIRYVCGAGFELVTELFSHNGPDGDYHFVRTAK